MDLLVFCTPEDAVVKTEHIEGGHGSYTRHYPAYTWTVGEACSDDLILGTES